MEEMDVLDCLTHDNLSEGVKFLGAVLLQVELERCLVITGVFQCIENALVPSECTL